MEAWLVACTGIGLAQLSVRKFGALTTLTRMLGGTAAVEHFSTSLCYLFEGTLVEYLRAGNREVPACLQVLSLQVSTKAQHGGEWAVVCSAGHSLLGEMRQGKNQKPDGQL